MALLELRVNCRSIRMVSPVVLFKVRLLNRILDMPSRQSGCCVTALALAMLCQNLPAQGADNTSTNGISSRGCKAQLLLELLPATGMKLSCIGLYCRCQ